MITHMLHGAGIITYNTGTFGVNVAQHSNTMVRIWVIVYQMVYTYENPNCKFLIFQ